MLWPRGVEALGIARSLLQGEGFSSPFAIPTGSTAFLPPVYPALLAGVESIFGIATKSSAWAILVLQCFLSAVTCVVIYYLALETVGPRSAKSAAWIWALFPYSVILPTNIIWESSLSALILTAGLYYFLRAQSHNSDLHWIMLGILWGFASLVNAALLLVLPALVLWRSTTRQIKTAHLAWFALAFVFSLSPWTARNYRVFHKFFPVRDNFALEFWLGNHQGAINGWMPQNHPAFSSSENAHYQAVGELRYMQEKGALAREFVRQQPALFVKNSFLRFATFWLASLGALWLGVPVLSLAALAGMAMMCRRRTAETDIYAITLLVYPLPYYLTHPDLKYQHPIEPLFAILAAYLVVSLFRSSARQQPHAKELAAGTG